MNLASTTRTFFGAAAALAALGIAIAPSVAGRGEPAPAALAHRFVPTNAEIVAVDEEAPPTF